MRLRSDCLQLRKKGVLLYRIEHRFTRLCDFFRAGAAAGELYGLRLLDDGLWEP